MLPPTVIPPGLSFTTGGLPGVGVGVGVGMDMGVGVGVGMGGVTIEPPGVVVGIAGSDTGVLGMRPGAEVPPVCPVDPAADAVAVDCPDGALPVDALDAPALDPPCL
jgi:hypothetical protein